METTTQPQEQTKALDKSFAMPMAEMTGNPVLDILLCPQRFEMLQRAANLFAQSKLVPEHFRGNVGGCFIVIQIAMGMKIDPFMLMQKTYVIGGKLGIEAQVAVALANQRGIFKFPLQYDFEEDVKNPERPIACTCTGILKVNDAKISERLTWREVQAEGWDKKGGSKWTTIPRRMFKYRTALWLIRTYAPELLMGLSSVDELEDQKVINITPEAPAAATAAMGGHGDLELNPGSVPKNEKKSGKAKKEPESPAEIVPPVEPPKEPKAPETPKAALRFFGCPGCGHVTSVHGKLVTCGECLNTKGIVEKPSLKECQDATSAARKTLAEKALATAKPAETTDTDRVCEPDQDPEQATSQEPPLDGNDANQQEPTNDHETNANDDTFNREALEAQLSELRIQAGYGEKNMEAKFLLMVRTATDGKEFKDISTWEESDFTAIINTFAKIAEQAKKKAATQAAQK